MSRSQVTQIHFMYFFLKNFEKSLRLWFLAFWVDKGTSSVTPLQKLLWIFLLVLGCLSTYPFADPQDSSSLIKVMRVQN